MLVGRAPDTDQSLVCRLRQGRRSTSRHGSKNEGGQDENSKTELPHSGTTSVWYRSSSLKPTTQARSSSDG
jgi:hypothetical protein